MGLFIRVRKRLTKDEGINVSVSNFTIIFRTFVKCAKRTFLGLHNVSNK